MKTYLWRQCPDWPFFGKWTFMVIDHENQLQGPLKLTYDEASTYKYSIDVPEETVNNGDGTFWIPISWLETLQEGDQCSRYNFDWPARTWSDWEPVWPHTIGKVACYIYGGGWRFRRLMYMPTI